MGPAAPRPLFVDVGANVGACSLHMLMTTDADIVAFEPGGDNLHYASRTLLRLATDVLPEARRRLLLVRAGAGAREQEHASLHQAVGNAGHAVIGHKPTQYAPLGHIPAQEVVLRRLDDVLWPRDAERLERPRPPSIALVKLDVEGFECQALEGMQELLRAGAIRAMKVEVFDTLLQLQGCSAVALQRVLAQAGFTLHRADSEGVPSSSALDPGLLHAPSHGSPYNIWCVLRLARAVTALAEHDVPPSPPPGGGTKGTAAAIDAGEPTVEALPLGDGWRGARRGRFLQLKQQRLARWRRLAEAQRRTEEVQHPRERS